MKKLFLLLFLSICFTIASQTTLKYSKAKITYNNSTNFKALTKLGVPLDHGIHKQGIFIISDFSEIEIEAAKSLGLEVEILIQDVKANFLQRNELATTQKTMINPTCATDNGNIINYPTPTNFSLGSMGGYLTYQEMLDNLDAMKSKYPNLITARANVGDFLTNGTSNTTITPAIGGNALQWVRISNSPDTDHASKPEIFYNAIHHAREPASLSQLIYYMWYLLENYDTDPEIKQIVDTTELYFIPVVNPDGYLYNQLTDPNGGGLWRKNRFNTHGVDINRNYDHYTDGTPATAVWNTVGTSNNTSSEIYAGTKAFSEIETQAIKWFIAQHDFTISIDNHTSGELLLMPYGFEDNNPTPDGDIYQILSEEMVSQNNYRNILITELTVGAGGSVDYMYGGTTQPHKKIFGFAPEIGTEFWPTSNRIDGICKEMMYLNLTAAKMTHNYSQIDDKTPLFIGDDTSFNASYTFRKLGLTGTGDFTVTITPISENIINVGNPKNYTNIQIETTTADFITIDLSNTIQLGDDITYTITIDGGSITASKTITKKFGTPEPVVNDTASTLTAYNTNGWATTTATFVSPPASITDSPSGNYEPNQNKSILLDQDIDLTDVTFANAQFYLKWDIENNWDYVQFEVSTDNGTSWVPQCGTYTNAGSTNEGQPTGEPLYDGTQDDWVLEEIDLSEYIGNTIKVRFQLVSDANTQGDGFFFDDLQINVITNPLLNVTEIPTTKFSVFPNPTKEIIQIQPSSSGKFDVQIRNILGQVIRSLNNMSGKQELNLSTLNTGLYFFTIEEEKNVHSFKVHKQ